LIAAEQAAARPNQSVGSLLQGAGARLRSAKCAVAILLTTALCASAPAAEVSPADLQAAMRALGFLSALQNRPSIAVGVVYVGGDPDSKALAARAAAMLTRLKGPGSSTVSANMVAVQELSQNALHVDALYLMPLPPDGGHTVSDFVKRQGVVSISNDPSCFESQACVLLVQAARSNMTIVLDTALAQATGAKFSTVFTMLVKRR
jgi:hypothetical protein